MTDLLLIPSLQSASVCFPEFLSEMIIHRATMILFCEAQKLVILNDPILLGEGAAFLT